MAYKCMTYDEENMVLIDRIKDEIKLLFINETSGHDFWHSIRVYKTAMEIAEKEQCGRLIVALAALLHDADDNKIFPTENYANCRIMMKRNGVKDGIVDQVVSTISMVSFRENRRKTPDTIEGKLFRTLIA